MHGMKRQMSHTTTTSTETRAAKKTGVERAFLVPLVGDVVEYH